MKTFLNAAVLLTLVSATVLAQINAGEMKSDPNVPFTMTQVATFKLPWRIAFLPDGRMLVTEKVGPVWLVTQQGEKTPIENVPAVQYRARAACWASSCRRSTRPTAASTSPTPNRATEAGTSGLALARARLNIGQGTASLEGLQVLWRDMPKGRGGQFGAQIAFSPDGQYLFLTVGDRQRFTPAQDPNTEVGKILRLTLDGKPAPGNPMAGKTGRDHSAADQSAARYGSGQDRGRGQHVHGRGAEPGARRQPGAPVIARRTVSPSVPTAGCGKLEHGPRGGDELNLIEPGKNYGWPLVSYAANYNGVPIPSPGYAA